MKLLLSGVIPPIVTPRIDNDTIDVQGLERLLNIYYQEVCMGYLSREQKERQPTSVTRFINSM